MRALLFARRKGLIFIFLAAFLFLGQISFKEWLTLKQEVFLLGYRFTQAKIYLYQDITVVSKKPIPQSYLIKVNNLFQKEKKYFSYEGKERVVIIFQKKQSLGGLFSPPSEGYYWGGVVYLSEDLESKALAHEMAHFLLDLKTGGKLSRYLHEGLAQWIEVNLGLPPAFLGDEKKVFISILELEKNLDDAENQYAAYRQSYYFIKFLEKKKGREGIDKFLEEVKRSGKDKAFIKVYGEREKDLFKNFIIWYKLNMPF
ncbi:basic secretory protein-like protein [Carboxydothermus pertinax]|uniref:Peptidase MA-like domain-containing protein n=1 Tax=Carboxydothermus pertinax TaxID=870242 RepID=A0A1L8CTB0_9THEO|nr:basic secretory protein-like protein [Carboxydothermus pertinax]GAV22137.1 hypothetical protein cpu_06470 [Carboxydothermus pertinax]